MMRLARAFERCNASSPLALSAPPNRSPRRMGPSQSTTTALGGSASQFGSSTTPATRPFKRLTPGEMAERCKTGLCYNCYEPYVQGHKCACLFYLEASDYTVEEPESDYEATAVDNDQIKPTISLAAIAGIHTEDTMQLYVQLG